MDTRKWKEIRQDHGQSERLIEIDVNQLENVGYAEEYLKLVEMHQKMPKIVQENVEKKLSEEGLDTLQWARDFMAAYERKRERKV